LREAEKVVEEIYSKIDKNVRIIWGTTIDSKMEKSIRAMLVITGVKSKQIIGLTQRSRDEKEFGIDFVS
jgi:cell division protein FtsZ